MDTAVLPVTIDLTQHHTKERPEEGYHNKATYQVAKRDAQNDIYRVLNIDSDVFTIFVQVKQAPVSRFTVAKNPAFVLSAGMDLFVYVEKKQENRHSGYTTEAVHLTIPNVCKAKRLVFRSPEMHHSSYTPTYPATLTVSVGGAEHGIHVSCVAEIAETAFNLSFGTQGTECMGALLDVAIPDTFYRRYQSEPLDFSLQSLFTVRGIVSKEQNCRHLMMLLKNRAGMTGASVLAPQGTKNVFNQVVPFYEELLRQDEIFLIAAFQTLLFECKRTINGVKVAKWFNEFFASARDQDTFQAKLQQVYSTFIEYESEQSYRYYRFEDLFVKLPAYTELRKAALRSQSGRALSKMVTDIESINFDEQKYPVLAGLIHDGSIPVSTFFRREGDEAYFLFNDNWDLFEEFLGKHRDVGIKLAQLASQRTTYEKSFMSYMYFILYDLPEYLKKHTGKHWTCLPSIVESAEELEPTQTGQTTKKRSALTPVVDNDACTVVVPYACLKVPGVSTTYTYSLNYSIVRRGLSIDGSVSSLDIEEKLNGRDDYGLMFYTLTWSAAGRGYPTFLIIFERLDGDETRVHFHRTHPLRSKGGDNNPVNNWIR